MERSTWILALEMSLFLFISSCVNCPLTRKDGMLSKTPSGKMSLIVKPLSDITISPGRRYSRTPQSDVIALSEALPPYRSLAKVITPLGATPIKVFIVVRPLYWLYNWHCLSRFSVLETATSVQSSTILQLGKGRKHSGKQVRFLAVEGMLFSTIPTYKMSYSAQTMVRKMFVTVAGLQLNL